MVRSKKDFTSFLSERIYLFQTLSISDEINGKFFTISLKKFNFIVLWFVVILSYFYIFSVKIFIYSFIYIFISYDPMTLPSSI